MSLPPLPELPADLDAWLASGDQALADLRPGSRRSLVWAHADRRRTPLSLVYLHGWSADPAETRPLCDLVAAELGANLYYPRLAGHGRDGQALADTTLEAWLADTAEALAVGQRLGERVVLVGCSTGGSLATIACGSTLGSALAPAATVLLAPNFGPRAFGSFLLHWPFAEQLAHAILGREREVAAEHDLHAAHWTLRYPTRALLPMAASVALARRQPFERMTTPMFAAWSDADETVDPRRIRKVLGRWAAQPKVLHPVPAVPDGSNHVVAGEVFGAGRTEPLAAALTAFLQRLD